MRNELYAVMALLLLAGCDGPSEARNSFARCQVNDAQMHQYRQPDPAYMQTCIESEGYVLDGKLKDVGARCLTPAARLQPACYRHDDLYSKWVAELGGR